MPRGAVRGQQKTKSGGRVSVIDRKATAVVMRE
jgi:hypothetical protein